MQLFGTFVEVEAENISTRLDQLIPVLLKTLQQGVEADSESSDDDDDDESEAENDENEAGGDTKRKPLDDKCLFNSLSCIGKLFTKLPTVFENEVYNSQINEFLSKSVFYGGTIRISFLYFHIKFLWRENLFSRFQKQKTTKSWLSPTGPNGFIFFF